ncbi:MAG: hypothetical protein ABJK25_00030 [Halieaceae bacterium]
MTEYELLDLVASGTDQMADMFSLYLTVLSAYLLVAYIAGSKLTALQFGGVTSLFIFASSGQALGIYQNGIHIGELYQKKQELSALTPYESQYVANTNVWVVAMVVAIVISVFFMLQVRRAKAE